MDEISFITEIVKTQGIVVAMLLFMCYQLRETDKFLKDKFGMLLDFVIKNHTQGDVLFQEMNKK